MQLIAILEDFHHGRCMSLPLRSTDVLESSSKSGKFYIRFVDAKFALPKGEKEAGFEFISLDMPEYASEHDDIVIGFDTEEGMLPPILCSPL